MQLNVEKGRGPDAKYAEFARGLSGIAGAKLYLDTCVEKVNGVTKKFVAISIRLRVEGTGDPEKAATLIKMPLETRSFKHCAGTLHMPIRAMPASPADVRHTFLSNNLIEKTADHLLSLVVDGAEHVSKEELVAHISTFVDEHLPDQVGAPAQVFEFKQVTVPDPVDEDPEGGEGDDWDEDATDEDDSNYDEDDE